MSPARLLIVVSTAFQQMTPTLRGRFRADPGESPRISPPGDHRTDRSG
jgi:hypothetical protein